MNYTLTKRKIKNGFNYQINIYENGNLLKRLSSHTNDKDIADKYARDLLFSDNHGKDFYTELEVKNIEMAFEKLIEKDIDKAYELAYSLSERISCIDY